MSAGDPQPGPPGDAGIDPPPHATSGNPPPHATSGDPPPHATSGDPPPHATSGDPPPPLPLPPRRAWPRLPWHGEPGPGLPAPVALAGGAVYAFGLLVAFMAVSTGLVLLLPDRPRLAAGVGLVLGLLVPALALATLLARTGLPVSPPARKVVPVGRAGWPLLAVAASGTVAAYAVMAPWIAALRGTGWEWVRDAARRATEAYGPFLAAEGPLDLVAVILVAVVLASACEEVAFRGGLQDLLAGGLKPATAVLVSGFVFAAFHFELLGFPARLLLGVSMGLVYHLTRSLLAAMLVHGFNNLIVVLLTLALDLPADAGAVLDAPPFGIADWLVAVGLATVGLLAWAASLAALARRVALADA